jgi:hypothetical protein
MLTDRQINRIRYVNANQPVLQVGGDKMLEREGFFTVANREVILTFEAKSLLEGALDEHKVLEEWLGWNDYFIIDDSNFFRRRRR